MASLLFNGKQRYMSMTAPESEPGSSPERMFARGDLAEDVHVAVDWAEQELFFRREMAKVISRFSSSTENLKEVFHLLSEILGLNRGRMFLLNPATGLLNLCCGYGLTRAEIERGVLAPGEGITGKVFESGQVAIVQDIRSDPEFLWRTFAREALPDGVTSVFFCPVQVNGQTRGVLNVNRFRGISRKLTDDMEILREVVAQASQLLRFDDLIAERVQVHTAALEHENDQLKRALDYQTKKYGITGESSKLKRAIRKIEQVAPSDVSVLLLGESGTGKELFARAVHMASGRADRPFVKLNCGAIPEALFESELFGHEKGAFTGAASARAGVFEDAHTGTLFLDEIGDLPYALQVKLLRALQERTVTRLGGRTERKVDVRIVAATNQNLQELVRSGRFRLDLFYRLFVVPIHLAALRERPEDVASLAQHFLQAARRAFQREVRLSGEALAALIRYRWPGNVRQLENVINRLALLCEKSVITGGEAEEVLAAEGGTWAGGAEPGEDVAATVDPTDIRNSAMAQGRLAVWDKSSIAEALKRAGNVKSRAAQQLGLTLSQLNYRIRQLGIQVSR